MKFKRYVTRSYDLEQTVSMSQEEIEDMLRALDMGYSIDNLPVNDWTVMREIWDYIDNLGFDINVDEEPFIEEDEEVYDYGVEDE